MLRSVSEGGVTRLVEVALLLGTGVVLSGCDHTVCSGASIRFEQTLELGENRIVIRASNERDTSSDSLISFDVDGVVRNTSGTTNCRVAAYLFDELPAVDAVTPVALGDISRPDDPPGGRLVDFGLLPSREGDRSYTLEFTEQVADRAPFTTWLVVTGCTDAPIEVELEAASSVCNEQGDFTDLFMTFEREG